jgi:hypothetical protein
MAMVMAMGKAMGMATTIASAAVAVGMMTVARKKAREQKQVRPRRAQRFVEKADERGNAHHCRVASCLNIMDHDVSINASFSFNAII